MEGSVSSLLFGYDLLRYIDGSKPCSPSEISANGQKIPNPYFILWQRQAKLLIHGIFLSLSERVILIASSSKTADEAWTPFSKYYASSSSSQVMELMNQLSENRGAISIVEYLGFICVIADELAIISSHIPPANLILHVLNGVGFKFKELATTVRTRGTVIDFKELHVKVIECDSFLK